MKKKEKKIKKTPRHKRGIEGKLDDIKIVLSYIRNVLCNLDDKVNTYLRLPNRTWTSIDNLNLPERHRNALIKNGILFIEDLEIVTKWELLLMRHMGRKGIWYIEKELSLYWKHLREIPQKKQISEDLIF